MSGAPRRKDSPHRHKRHRDRSSSPTRHAKRRARDSPDRLGRHGDDRHHERDSFDRNEKRNTRDDRREGRPHDRTYSPQERSRREDQDYRERRPAQLLEGPPEQGTIHRATVRNVRPFGIFVEMEGYRRHGLVHNSQVAEDMSFSREDEDEAKVKAMEFIAPVGSQVWVKVVEIRDDGRGNPKINCSMKAVSQDSGADLDPDNAATRRSPGDAQFRGPVSDAPPEVGSVLEASVASVKPYGIFVKLKGYRANGLVHLSQVSDHLDIGRDESDDAKIAALSSVHSVGDHLFVKVVEVSEDPSGRTKVGCSIKLADQKQGTDLDPNNMKWQPRGEGGGPGGGGGRAPIQASVNVEPGGTIDWGYLKAGDRQFGAPGQQYDMIGDEVLALLPPPPPPADAGALQNGDGAHSAPEPPGNSNIGSIQEALAILEKYGKKGKHKKEKKEKKGKEKKEKKEKKAKKKKKKKPSDSTTDSGDA